MARGSKGGEVVNSLTRRKPRNANEHADQNMRESKPHGGSERTRWMEHKMSLVIERREEVAPQRHDGCHVRHGGVAVCFGLGRGNPSQYDKYARQLNRRQRWPGRETWLTRRQTSSVEIRTPGWAMKETGPGTKRKTTKTCADRRHRYGERRRLSPGRERQNTATLGDGEQR